MGVRRLARELEGFRTGDFGLERETRVKGLGIAGAFAKKYPGENLGLSGPFELGDSNGNVRETGEIEGTGGFPKRPRSPL